MSIFKDNCIQYSQRGIAQVVSNYTTHSVIHHVMSSCILPQIQNDVATPLATPNCCS